VSEARGEYVPAPCTHRPSKHPSGVRMRPSCDGRIWAPQGGLSRNKVAVEESAAGSPPTDRDQASGLTHLHLVVGHNNQTELTGDHKSPRVGKRRLLHGPAGLTKTYPRRISPHGDVGCNSRRVRTSYRRRIRPLKCGTAFDCDTTTDAPGRVKPRLGRVDSPTIYHLGGEYETVCTCDPGVHWTRSVERVTTTLATMPAGGLLGSGADEGRAKLR
jgi:hypothetical protein